LHPPGRARRGPQWAFLLEMSKLNTESPPHGVRSPMLPDRNVGRAWPRLRGVGGLNLWHPWGRLPHWGPRAHFFLAVKTFDYFSEIKEFKPSTSAPRRGCGAKPRHSLFNRASSDGAWFFAQRSRRIYFRERFGRGRGVKTLGRWAGDRLAVPHKWPRNSEKLFFDAVGPSGRWIPKIVAKFGVGGVRSQAYGNVT
jgi:hypothetical protein